MKFTNTHVLGIRNVYCGNTWARIYNNYYKCVSLFVELWEWKKNTVCIENKNIFSSQSKSSAVSESDVRSWYAAKTHRTEQHPEISGPSKQQRHWGKMWGSWDMCSLLLMCLSWFFVFSTWKVHLCVPEVPVMPSPIEDPVDSMHGGTRACTVHRLSLLVLIQKYASCIMDFNKFALMY